MIRIRDGLDKAPERERGQPHRDQQGSTLPKGWPKRLWSAERLPPVWPPDPTAARSQRPPTRA